MFSSSRRQQHISAKGFSLAEMVIYVALVTLVTTGAVTFMLSLDDLLIRQKAERLISNTAAVAFERVLFEARQSDDVMTGLSTLNSSSSVVVFGKGTDQILFGVTNGTLYMSENTVVQGDLTRPEVSVDEFYVYHYPGIETELVRIVALVSATIGSTTVTERLEGATILRQSYDE